MIMQSAIYGLSLFFITISLNAQQKWGYALASVKYDGHEVLEVERHTDYTKLFKNPPENLHFNKPAYNYLSNKGAKQKRKRAMQFCEPDKCEIVILR